MRVVAYCESTEFGGAERSLQLLLTGLSPEVEVAVVAVDPGVAERLASVRPQTQVHLVGPVRNKRHLRPIVERIRLIRRLRPDVFHASLHTPWTCQAGLLAAMVAPGVRIVAVEQLPLPTASVSQRAVKRLMSRRLDAHVAVGAKAARLVEQYAGLRDGTVETIYNGVPDDGPVPPRPPRARPLVGSVGRLVREKGFDVLLRAIAEVPELDVAIVGEGPERPRLEALIAELELTGRAELRGAAPDARTHLPDFDVFVLASRHEGFPLALVEAALAGLPVVAAEVGSIGEIVLDRDTGLLVPSDDHAALATALRTLLDEPGTRTGLADAGRRYARERFTEHTMVAAYEALYRRVLA